MTSTFNLGKLPQPTLLRIYIYFPSPQNIPSIIIIHYIHSTNPPLWNIIIKVPIYICYVHLIYFFMIQDQPNQACDHFLGQDLTISKFNGFVFLDHTNPSHVISYADRALNTLQIMVTHHVMQYN
jgi:hypothetical protein